MQDDTRARPPQATDLPASHEATNRPGMTNGVPDQAHEGDSRAMPHDDRHETEKAAAAEDRKATKP